MAYLKYTYTSSATAAQILADVVLFLTGTTDVADFSASCDDANSEIDVSVDAAGWTVHDASAGTNAQVLKALVAGSASQYKYLKIDTNSAGYIKLSGYETWSATAHTGTNLCYNSDSTSYCQRLNVAAGGRLDIRANVHCCWAFSFQGGAYGSSAGTSPSGILERTRLSPWDTADNGYPPFMFACGVTAATYTEPRSLDAAGADVTGSSATCAPIHAFGGGGALPALPTTTVQADDTGAVFKHVMVPFGGNRVAHGHLGGDFSSLCDIYLTTYANGSAFDTVTYNGGTYVIWTYGATHRFAVRKG